MAALVTLFIRLFGLALLAMVFSCGGDGNSNSPANAGSLTVTVTGLPTGVGAVVTVTGPGNFSQSLTASQTLSLTPGTYTVAALNAGNGTLVFAPQIVSQTATVSTGATANITVAYSGLALTLQDTNISGLAAPLFLTAPIGDARLFIVERAGTIRIVQNGVLLATPFLTISGISTTGEGGLLSMAFDPNYATNGFFYVYYVAQVSDPGGEIRIERFQVSVNSNVANPTPLLRIITIPHPTNTNHYGGRVAFGPDGFLYAGPGDGGSANDPPGNGQNLNTLLGKLLRIDVNSPTGTMNYAIPPTNPFFNQANRRGEIWAYGLRNPWRYAFDFTTNQLYIGDVGQSAREEVDVAPAATVAAPGAGGGLNYGWNITEGTLCFLPASGCNMTGITLPVLDYVNPTDGCAITGGFVYRGNAVPEIQGRYFYSDFCRGWLRSLVVSGGAAVERLDWGITNVGNIVSFGEDGLKELYMLSSNNRVFRVVRQ